MTADPQTIARPRAATASVPFVTRYGAHIDMTRIGFGAAPIGNMARAISDADAIATVTAALDFGLRHVDVAPLYGHGLAELRVGAALQGRTNVTLSTKVGRLLVPCAPGAQDGGIYVDLPDMGVVFDYSYDGVMRSYEASLARLRRRIDILYVHDVDASAHGSAASADARITELIDGGGWRALEELRRAGDVRAVGAGVNEVGACLRLLDVADPDLFLLAGRYTLLDQRALDALLPRCLADGVGIVIGGPFNSGILATGAVPDAWYDYAPASAAIFERTRAIERVCAAHSVPLAAAALAFPLLHPAIVSVIPGGRTPDEVRRNVDLLDHPIPPALWRDLAGEGLMHPGAPC